MVSILLHAYVALRIVPELPPAGSIGFALLLLASAVLMPRGLRSRHRQPGRLTTLLTWTALLLMGLFSSLFVLTLLRDLSLAVLGVLGWLRPGFVSAVTSAGWARQSASAVPVLGALVTLWGFVNARRTAAVVRVDVPIDGLPTALQGFTIAQISDIHVGPTIRGSYVGAIVAAVNQLGADMVAVTGDLVDGSVRELAEHVAPLAGLASRHGTFFVTGNHEYYSGAAAWVHELRRLGLRVLMNEHAVLSHGGASVVVGGVTDYGAHGFDPHQRSDAVAALAGAPPTAGVKILLAHQPRSAAGAEQAGFDLQLSGHTHGGQFLPWNWLVRLQQPFTAGLHRLRRLWVYTSRGTGYWGPPKRFGAPSEITLLRLVQGAATAAARPAGAMPAG